MVKPVGKGGAMRAALRLVRETEIMRHDPGVGAGKSI